MIVFVFHSDKGPILFNMAELQAVIPNPNGLPGSRIFPIHNIGYFDILDTTDQVLQQFIASAEEGA